MTTDEKERYGYGELGDDDDAPAKPQSRGVGFRSRGSIEEVRRISRISQYDLDEVIAYWGDDDEHQLRKEELKEAAKDFQMSRRMSDNATFTSVGIASLVGKDRQEKKENRYKSRAAVLDEQELQEAEGIIDDELIADIYGFTANKAKSKAHSEALRIEEEVKRLYLEEEPLHEI